MRLKDTWTFYSFYSIISIFMNLIISTKLAMLKTILSITLNTMLKTMFKINNFALVRSNIYTIVFKNSS